MSLHGRQCGDGTLGVQKGQASGGSVEDWQQILQGFPGGEWLSQIVLRGTNMIGWWFQKVRQ